MSARSVIVALAVALFAGVLPATASAERAFSQRFATNDVGDIAIAANTLMTCPSACAQEHETTIPNSGSVNVDNNNNYTMARVDVDGDAATFDSSSATLNLPAGARVLYAGLYWSGDTAAGAGTGAANAPTAASRGTMKLKVPGGGYQSITADQLDDEGSRYQGFANVTTLVSAAGGGLYWAANVQAATGQDRYAGWSLVVAYHDDAGTPHNLTIFDGLRVLSSSVASISIPVSGFHTTPTGQVNTTLGVVAYEGDLGLTGDGMKLDGQTISDAVNPSNNVFDSSISVRGTRVMTGRNPAQENHFGFDADLLDADGLLANNATSATIGLTTGGETYYPAVLTFSSALLAPHIRTTTSVVDLNGGQVEPGDILEYTIDGTNDGTDTADGTVLTTTLPAGLQWVDGQLQIVSGTGAGPLTDAAGDDRGAWDPSTGTVTWYLGTGATPSAGGSIPVNDAFQTRFRVKVGAVPNGGSIAAPGITTYTGATTSDDYGLTGTGGNVTVHSADLDMAVAHTGGLVRGAHVDYTLTTGNVGSAPTHGEVAITDDLPADLVLDGTPSGDGWTCDAVDRHVHCTRSDSLAVGDHFPPITVPARVTTTAGATVADSATVTGGGDGLHANDAASDSAPTASKVDLQVAITPPATDPIAGAATGFSAVVTNLGPSIATTATVVVPVPAGLTDVSATLSGATGACAVADGRATCVVDRLAPGAQATVAVRGTVAQAAANQPLTLTASASAAEPDANPDNDHASDSLSVGTDSNLGLAVMAPDSPVLAGQVVDFSLVVNNVGPSDAQDVVISQELPVGATIVDLDSRCAVDGRIVTCTLGTIAAGQQVVLEFEVKATQAFDGATLGSKARVSSSTGDVDGADNSVARPAGRCLSRRSFDIRLRVPYTSRKIAVTVGGRAAKVWHKKGRIRAKVDLRGRLTSRVTVRISAITPRGYRIAGSRRYRTCDIRRPTVRAPKI